MLEPQLRGCGMVASHSAAPHFSACTGRVACGHLYPQDREAAKTHGHVCEVGCRLKAEAPHACEVGCRLTRQRALGQHLRMDLANGLVWFFFLQWQHPKATNAPSNDPVVVLQAARRLCNANLGSQLHSREEWPIARPLGLHWV